PPRALGRGVPQVPAGGGVRRRGPAAKVRVSDLLSSTAATGPAQPGGPARGPFWKETGYGSGVLRNHFSGRAPRPPRPPSRRRLRGAQSHLPDRLRGPGAVRQPAGASGRGPEHPRGAVGAV